MTASITNGNGPDIDGNGCAVVNTNAGGNCVAALGTPIVRSRCELTRPRRPASPHPCPQQCRVVALSVHE